MKIKFYWNENYPDTIYVMGKNIFDNNADTLYVLREAIEDSPFTGLKDRAEMLIWESCSWATDPKSLKMRGFRLMGTL